MNKSHREVPLAITHNEPIEICCVTFTRVLHSRGWRKVLLVLMEALHEPKHCAETELNNRADGMSTE